MIGKLIREIIRQRKVTYRKIASDLDMDHGNLYHSLTNGANPEWTPDSHASYLQTTKTTANIEAKKVKNTRQDVALALHTTTSAALHASAGTPPPAGGGWDRLAPVRRFFDI